MTESVDKIISPAFSLFENVVSEEGAEAFEWRRFDADDITDLSTRNSTGTTYRFLIKLSEGEMVSLKDAYWDVHVACTTSGAQIAAYVSNDTDTHIAFQNSYWSLFDNAQFLINNKLIETIDEPGLLDTINWLYKEKDVVENKGKLGGFIKDVSTIDIRTSGNTGFVARNLELRTASTTGLHKTLDPIFHSWLSKPTYTYANHMEVRLHRAVNSAITELGANAVATPVIHRLQLWVPFVRPSGIVKGALMEGVIQKLPQNFSFKEIAITRHTATSTSFSVARQSGTPPKYILVGYQPTTQVNKRVFYSGSITDIYVEINGKRKPEQPFEFNSSPGELQDIQRPLREFFRKAADAPLIDADDFISKYWLVGIDTSRCVDDEPEYDNENVSIRVNVKSGSNLAGDVIILYVFDKLVQISGEAFNVDTKFGDTK